MENVMTFNFFIKTAPCTLSLFVCCVTQSLRHSIQTDKPTLHSYIHSQDHKHTHQNENTHGLISQKLSEILESSVQQII